MLLEDVKRPNRPVPRSILLIDPGASFSLAIDIANTGLKTYILSETPYKAQWMPKGVTLLPLSSTSKDQVVGSIDAALQSISPDIILPVAEETLFEFWDKAPDWLSRVRPAIEPEFRALYRSKHLLGAFVQRLGVLIPQTHLLERMNPEEISSVISELGLPIVVKGSRGTGGRQVRIAHSYNAALQAITELHDLTGDLPALQEYLSGATYLVGGVFDRGRPVHMIAAEKTEMLPQQTGPAIMLTTCDEDELIKAANTVFLSLGLSGIASLDFVRGQDGRFRFLEINPRPWGSIGLAKAIEIDVVGTWCRLLHGDHVPSALEYPVDRTWAKMPDYLFVQPGNRSTMIRRALHPVALRSWPWHSPRLFLFEARRAWWRFLSYRWR
jgi:hypothetical protein